MKIKILRSAQNDLLESYYFYELQQDGIGDYFLESMFSDIESLKIYAGIHPIYFEKKISSFTLKTISLCGVLLD
jgi:hypothetical protein